MTCIIGLVAGGRVWMGADSAGVSGWDLTVRADSKVFRNGPYVMGFTTSFRMGQLLRHSLKPPELPDKGLERFMVTTFVDAVRDCLKAGGWASKTNEREDAGDFLVGVRGRLYAVCNDYQVAESVDGYMALGCGADFAMGALAATEGQSPRRRVTAALGIAQRFSAGVRGPFVVRSVGRQDQGSREE